ncbi:23171_t:CDS:2 [Cetraspora pellucida]|uniref:23171_t:CDS:1 n=1 Tax=Cetraspora pellucida TaxID=1433469 RepID=A0A9N9J5V6_9GLOM|nr:23171_t:CDS:2 [Cetraspora pellucida]
MKLENKNFIQLLVPNQAVRLITNTIFPCALVNIPNNYSPNVLNRTDGNILSRRVISQRKLRESINRGYEKLRNLIHFGFAMSKADLLQNAATLLENQQNKISLLSAENIYLVGLVEKLKEYYKNYIRLNEKLDEKKIEIDRLNLKLDEMEKLSKFQENYIKKLEDGEGTLIFQLYDIIGQQQNESNKRK